nr:amino acid permease [Lachnospiraceae bacterium]
MKKENMNTKIASFSAWAYAFGCAVGWGAFMMPGDIFLPKAGPLGALIGILIASLIMFFVGQSTFYMAKTYPEDAGVHVYISRILGHDHGFLSAWSILLAYISVLWSNSTAIILLIRSVWGSVLQFGFHYKIAGYDVYFGEILLSAIIIVFFAVVAIFGKKFVRVLHIILALVHIIFVIVLFIGVFAGGRHSDTFGFANVDVSEPLQVFNIVMLAPWMYVGFEAFMYMFNSGGRKPHNADKVTVISIITIAAAYILPMLIPVFGLPDGYSSWDAFIAASSSETVSGLFASPVFYSTYYVLGKKGLYLLLVCILCAISTSIFGSYRALGRLLTSMSEEKLMPKCVGKKYKNGEPIVGILIVMAVSLIIPLTGRTALGWMIDITTITATIVYVYSMISVLKLIKNDPNSKPGFKVVPILGMVLAGTSFLFLLIPNILSETKIATESYLILFIWSILGVAYYMYVYRKDKENKYGQTPIMWIFMSFIIMFSSVMWIRQRNVDEISAGQRSTESLIDLIGKNSLIQMIVVILVLVALYSLFNILFKRQKEADKKAVEMESKSEAKTAFLFNMSHDIRTPMNAILGFTDLALIDPADEEKVRDYLGKIKSSSNHLLTLINDMLEMSRIESGKVEINELPEDL